MAILAGIDRGYVSREEGLRRMEKNSRFSGKADRFKGAYPHWWNGETGHVQPFGQKDNGGDLVETAFLMQGLLAVHQYYAEGSAEEKTCRTYRQVVAGSGLELVPPWRTECAVLALESRIWLGNEFPGTWLQ